MIRASYNVFTWITLMLCTFCLSAVYAQFEPLSALNSPINDIPVATARLENGNILLVLSRYKNYYSKRDMVIAVLDEYGNLRKQKEIALTDTGIATVGGAFLKNDSQYIVFATFKIDTIKGFNGKHWGYMVFDTALNIQQRVLLPTVDPRADPLATTTWLTVKKSPITQRYYGTVYVYTLFDIYRTYPIWFIMDSSLNLVHRAVDTAMAIYARATGEFERIYSVTDEAGDLVEINDSLYLTNYSTFGILGSVTYTRHLNSGKNYDHYGGGVNSLYGRGLNFYTESTVKLMRWSDTTFLIAGHGTYDVYGTRTYEDSLYRDVPGFQSIIAIIDATNSNMPLGVVKLPYQYAFVEQRDPKIDPNEAGNFIGPNGNYSSAMFNSVDYYSQNELYYARAMGALSYFSFEGYNSYLVSQFDKNLKRIWNKKYDMDTSTLVPYSVIALRNGGCLVFLRHRASLFEDPDFVPLGKMPTYDIWVHQYSKDGVLTSVRPIGLAPPTKPTLYPNPVQAGGNVNVQGIPTFTQAQLVSANGQTTQLHCERNQSLQIPQVASGLYYLRVFSQQWYQFRLVVE